MGVWSICIVILHLADTIVLSPRLVSSVIINFDIFNECICIPLQVMCVYNSLRIAFTLWGVVIEAVRLTLVFINSVCTEGL